MARGRVFAAAVCGVLLMGSQSGAARANVPWDVTPITPANGGVYGLSSPTPDGKVGAVAAEFASSVAFPAATAGLFGSPAQAVMEVSPEQTLGQDGTLADDKLVSFGVLYARDSDPSRFAGSVSAGAFLYPGTYYFQYSTNVPNQLPERYLSPIFSFTVVAPTPPQPATTPTSPTVPSSPSYRLSRRRAISKAKRYVGRRLKGKRARASCSRLNASRLECRVRYARGKRKSAVTVAVYRDSGGWLHVRRISS